MSEIASEKLTETIELLTKDNYNTWRMKAKALLDVSSLWDYVSGDIKIPSNDAVEQEVWKTKDKRAKSMLILQISDALLPLVEDCKTSNEIWLKLENVYGDKGDSIESSEIDEDTIINDIEESVDEFFETINDPPEKEKKSLNFTDKLLLRLKENGLKKLPDRKIIADIVDQFITDVIEKLSKTEVKERKMELSGKLIDDLLIKFDINPHQNDDDDATSNVDVAETPEKRLIESSEIDEDTIINDIEESVDEFFETINDPSEKEKKSLNFTDKLLLRLKKNGLKKLPDRKIIADIVDQFITDVIEKLSKTEVKERKMELSGKLIDDLLVKFDMNPHQNDDDDATSNVDVAETPEKTADSREKGDYDGDKMNRILEAIDALAENNLFEFNPFHESTSIQRELCGEQGDCGNYQSPNLYTPPATPGPRQARKCGVCRQEGHNRTTCPLNKPGTPASKSSARSTSTPSTPRKCGVCGIAGHNRTTCSLNKTASPASKSSQTVSSPSRSYSCGICGGEGHNRTTCSLNKTVSPASKSSPTVSSPSRSYSCGICGGEGHNRTTCSLNKTVSPASKSSPTVSSPSRSYSCGICGGEGHNRTTCSLNKTVSPASKSSPTVSSPSRSYSCGICGGEGHNRTTCSLNKTVSPASKSSPTVSSPSRSYSCGICGGEGHNRTTCSLNKTVASPSQSFSRSASSTPSRSYSCGACGSEGHNRTTCPSLRSNTPSPRSYATSTPVRSYSCGTCGGQGHNSRTCSAGRSSSSSYSSPSYSYAAPSPSYSGGGRRSYTCGNCGGSGHNRRTCSG